VGLFLFAAVDDQSIDWVMNSVQWLVTQFQNRNYMPACGMLMLLVWAVKRFSGDALKAERLALLSAGLGVLSAVGMELLGLTVTSNKVDLTRAIVNGLMVGAGASGFWSLLGKQLLNKNHPSITSPADGSK
jgi:hypothetical protein